MKIKLLIPLLFLSITFFYPQNNINAPFVSKLTFETSNGKILLKWKNPEDFNEYLSIYRSNAIIDTREKLDKSTKIAFLKNNEEKYIDIPDQPGAYYYAVIITKKSTNKNEAILISYRNYTITPSDIKKDDFFKIKKLNVSSVNTYNKINWDFESSSKDSIKVMIYRNTSKIDSKDALNSSIKIATLDIETKLYIDVPVSNIPYFYAVLLEGEAVKEFIPDVNFTSKSFVISKKLELLSDFTYDNFTPLPLLVLKNDPKSGKFFLDKQILRSPKKISYNDPVKKIINFDKNKYKDIYKKYENNHQANLQSLNFHMLNNEDIYEPAEYSAEYKSAINYILNKDFISSQLILEELIKNILPDELSERTSYYLGLIYYQNGDYYKSYMYLVYSSDRFRKEVEPYLKSIEMNIFSKLER